MIGNRREMLCARRNEGQAFETLPFQTMERKDTTSAPDAAATESRSSKERHHCSTEVPLPKFSRNQFGLMENSRNLLSARGIAGNRLSIFLVLHACRQKQYPSGRFLWRSHVWCFPPAWSDPTIRGRMQVCREPGFNTAMLRSLQDHRRTVRGGKPSAILS